MSFPPSSLIGATILAAVLALGIPGAQAGTPPASTQAATAVPQSARDSSAKPFKFDSPIGVVMKLYHDFAFQAVIDQNGVPYDDILNQPKPVLERYFTNTLVKLVLADRSCAVAQGGICNIDFMPLWASQDATGAVVQISQGNKPEEIVASLSYPGETEKLELIYSLAKTDRGWRIRDIQGKAWSLSTTLSGK